MKLNFSYFPHLAAVWTRVLLVLHLTVFPFSRAGDKVNGGGGGGAKNNFGPEKLLPFNSNNFTCCGDQDVSTGNNLFESNRRKRWAENWDNLTNFPKPFGALDKLDDHRHEEEGDHNQTGDPLTGQFLYEGHDEFRRKRTKRHSLYHHHTTYVSKSLLDFNHAVGALAALAMAALLYHAYLALSRASKTIVVYPTKKHKKKKKKGSKGTKG